MKYYSYETGCPKKHGNVFNIVMTFKCESYDLHTLVNVSKVGWILKIAYTVCAKELCISNFLQENG